MKELRITSPGVLLILALIASGGIFLLDLFYLQPNVSWQERQALRDEASRTEGAAKVVLTGEQASLEQACAAWAQSVQVKKVGDAHPTTRADAQMPQALAEGSVGAGWVCDESGQLLRSWTAALPTPSQSQPPAEDIAKSVMQSAAGRGDNGMVFVTGGAVLFARHNIRDGTQSEPAGSLWLIRRIDDDLMGRLASRGGIKLSLAPGGEMPRNDIGDSSSPTSVWSDDADTLSIAWPACDVTGRTRGFFQADLPVSHVHRQAAASRRMVLIVLSLSTGLSLLVIVGAHILVTGPVVRLLRRLQRLEVGEGETSELVRDLHGEPLMLARRLESAFDRLAYISRTDQLTGLSNRRHFEEVLNAFYNQARRYNRPMSLIIMDVDFFKAVNDTGGHQAGDNVLKMVARGIETACRKVDLPARFGGDEFAILLPETSCSDAYGVAERICEELAAHPVCLKNLQMNLTVSVGIADLDSGEMDGPQAMLSLADQALYAAKEGGRNRIVQAHDISGINWQAQGEHGGKVDVLCKKLAGLDNQFKDLFLRAIEEVMVVLEHRNPHMVDHARKAQRYAVLIGREMGLPLRVLKRIQIGAMLQDIGMVAMPDTVLLNTGTLDDAQMVTMRNHPLLSVRIMQGMEFLEQEIPAVRYHHERWDGKGYPEGIRGSQIPLTARILSIADSFDAITSPRSFRSAKSMEEAVEEIKAASGVQFDPAVVEAFCAVATRMGQTLMELPASERDMPLAEVVMGAAEKD